VDSLYNLYVYNKSTTLIIESKELEHKRRFAYTDAKVNYYFSPGKEAK